MNKNILYAMLAAAGAFGLASCNENSWNDHFLDGFEEGVNYESSQTGAYTLTADDYAAISKAMEDAATTEAEKNAAIAIGTNYYFNKDGIYTAQTVLPEYFLNTSLSPYYLGDNNSVVDVMFSEVSNEPVELTSIAAAKTYTVSEDDYKKLWGNSTVYINSFAPEVSASSNVPVILDNTFSGDNAVTSGTYALVTYNNAEQNPVFQWDDAPEPSANLYSAASFTAGKYVIVDPAASKDAVNLASGKNFGYLDASDVTVEGNTVKGFDPQNAIWQFVSTGVDNEYYIQDMSGRYYYQNGSYNSFNVNKTLEADNAGYVWIVTSEGNDTWKIFNKGVSKWMQFPNDTFGTWGSYGEAKAGYLKLYTYVEVGEPTGTIVYNPISTTVNTLYYYNGSGWSVAEGVMALNPADYTAMGMNNDELTEPAVYIPVWLKGKLPYAQDGDQEYVVYNGTNVSLFVYDGTAWSLNNNDLELVTGRFEKKNGAWQFVKYVGMAIYNLFTDNTIELNRNYLIVSNGMCAAPFAKKDDYGYVDATKVSISGNQILQPSDVNSLYFSSSFTNNDVEYTVPEGKFMIQDSNRRYYYMGGAKYQSINLSKVDAYPTVTDAGEISPQYLWSATLNADGTWLIVNESDGLVRTWMYSLEHTSYGIYKEMIDGRVYPNLYLMSED